MTHLTSEPLSPQGLHTYEQAFQFFLTWGGDPQAAHEQAMLLARGGTNAHAVGPDVFGPPADGAAAPSHATRPAPRPRRG